MSSLNFKRNVVTSGHCCQTVSPDEIQIVAGEHSFLEVSGNEQVKRSF